MHIREGILFVFCVIGVYPITAMPAALISSAVCIEYDFETNFELLFSNEGLYCDGLDSWTEGQYSSIDVELPIETAQKFISPQVELSCISSFPFTMTGGTVEVKVYIDSVDAQLLDQVYVIVEREDGSNAIIMGMGGITSTDSNFVNGWQTLSVALFGATTFEGRLFFLGNANVNSTVLVDSFTYKSTNYAGECVDAEEYITTTAEPESTTVTETEPTTVTETETTTVTEIEPSTTVVIDTTEQTTEVVTEPATVTETTTEVVTEEATVTEASSTIALPTVIVPEPTISTPAPGTGTCPTDPHVHWLLPHESDCNLFYQCLWGGQKAQLKCQDGLHFNPIIQVCDWPWNAGCTTQ